VADSFKIPLQVLIGGVAAFFSWWVGIYILPLVGDVEENTKEIRELEKQNARVMEHNKSIRREIDRIHARQDALDNRQSGD